MIEADQKTYVNFLKMSLSDKEKTNPKLFFLNPQLAVFKPDLVLAISLVSDRLVHKFSNLSTFYPAATKFKIKKSKQNTNKK